MYCDDNNLLDETCLNYQTTRKILQSNGTEERKLDIKTDQLSREHKILSRALDRELSDYTRRNSIVSTNSNYTTTGSVKANSYKSNDSDFGQNDVIKRREGCLRTQSLKDRRGHKHLSILESNSNSRGIIVEEDQIPAASSTPTKLLGSQRQRSMSSLYFNNVAHQSDVDSDLYMLPDWQKLLVDKIRSHKYQDQTRLENEQITARMTGVSSAGCYPMRSFYQNNSSNTPLNGSSSNLSSSSNPNSHSNSRKGSTKRNYMQATASSRAKIL